MPLNKETKLNHLYKCCIKQTMCCLNLNLRTLRFHNFNNSKNLKVLLIKDFSQIISFKLGIKKGHQSTGNLIVWIEFFGIRIEWSSRCQIFCLIFGTRNLWINCTLWMSIFFNIKGQSPFQVWYTFLSHRVQLPKHYDINKITKMLKFIQMNQYYTISATLYLKCQTSVNV